MQENLEYNQFCTVIGLIARTAFSDIPRGLACKSIVYRDRRGVPGIVAAPPHSNSSNGHHFPITFTRSIAIHDLSIESLFQC